MTSSSGYYWTEWEEIGKTNPQYPDLPCLRLLDTMHSLLAATETDQEGSQIEH
ncbi:hypothetical protein P7K49_029759, partial [Saguinus oedipus]